MADAPRVIFHSYEQARAALEVAAEHGRAIILLTAPGAARYAGPDLLKEMADQAAEGLDEQREAAVIDCGDDAGIAMAALRAGWSGLVFSGDAETARKLSDMAAASGAQILGAAPTADDPGPEGDAADVVRRVLGPGGP